MLNIAVAFLLLLDLARAFRAHHVGERHFAGLVKRQVSSTQCATVSAGPSLCARSCGPGNIICPGGGTTYCFDPSAGETCCKDGGFCPAGKYCATYSDGDVTCCFNNQTLAQCGVAARGATIAGGSSSSSPPPSSSTSPEGSSPISPGGSSSTSPGGNSSPLQPSGHQSTPVPSGSGSLICKPVENPTCERSCGPGWVTCQELPHCYNPSMGQSCCSDGSYCPAGSSCSSGGCCPDGQQCSGGSAPSAINATPSQVVFPTSPGVTYTYQQSQTLTPGPGQTTRTQYVGQGTSSQAAQSTVVPGIATTDFHLALDAVAVLLTAFGVLLL